MTRPLGGCLSKNSVDYHLTPKTIVFGIDQSYSNFAIVVFQGLNVIDRVVFHAGEDNASNQKKQYPICLGSTLKQLIYLQDCFRTYADKYNPKYLVFEGLSFGSIGNRVFQLGGLYFHLTASFLNNTYTDKADNIISITPQQAKNYARGFLNEDQCYELKDGQPIILKSGKRKLKKMEKSDMRKALINVGQDWILDGYSISSQKTPTGVYDLCDAYFIGRSFIEPNLQLLNE